VKARCVVRGDLGSRSRSSDPACAHAADRTPVGLPMRGWSQGGVANAGAQPSLGCEHTCLPDGSPNADAARHAIYSFGQAAIIQTLHAVVFRQTLAGCGCDISCVRRMNLMSCEPAATCLSGERSAQPCATAAAVCNSRSRVQQPQPCATAGLAEPSQLDSPGTKGQVKVGPRYVRARSGAGCGKAK